MPPIPSNTKWKDYKPCYTCGNYLHFTQFHKANNRPGGVSTRCRACTKLYRECLEKDKQKKYPMNIWVNPEAFSVSFE